MLPSTEARRVISGQSKRRQKKRKGSIQRDPQTTRSVKGQGKKVRCSDGKNSRRSSHVKSRLSGRNRLPHSVTFES